MSRQASEILQSHSGEQPLLLQLHYQPPHWPYDPGAEFDKFTDPTYAGDYRPNIQIDDFTQKGTVFPSKIDLEEIVGLYDGNLLRADAAVGIALKALRDSGRMDNSVIVITSDHGEVFGEHGQFGHNSNLQEEMLHVPLIVRLPGGQVPANVNPQRLASVLDVLPTILGQLGLRPVTAVDGIDLIHTASEPRWPRMLFFRRLKNQSLAARTPTWKAIVTARGSEQVLFQINLDPEERRNLLAEQAWIFAGLTAQLRIHLEMSMRRGLEGKAVELTPEAEEALRALGYLE